MSFNVEKKVQIVNNKDYKGRTGMIVSIVMDKFVVQFDNSNGHRGVFGLSELREV